MDQKKSLITDQMLALICTKYDLGKLLVTIASELEVPYRTVVSVVRVYKSTGRTSSNSKNIGRTKIMNDEAREIIKTKIHDDVSTTLKGLQ